MADVNVPNSQLTDKNGNGTPPLIRWMNEVRKAIEAIDPFVPTYIAPAEKFTIPKDRQAVFASNIDNEGILDLEGLLIEVD